MKQGECPREWTDDDWVTLSALQHYSYCPRQYALIFKEQIFDENYYTMRGRLAHERADSPGGTHDDGVLIMRSLAVWSDRHALQGKCDVVEIGSGQPYPVEYKHGHSHASIHDEVQLCAQAICLEEMFNTVVTCGAIYHISSRHRREVVFTQQLREHVIQIAESIRALRATDDLPAAVHDARCPDCSLVRACMPGINTDREDPPSWFDKLPSDL